MTEENANKDIKMLSIMSKLLPSSNNSNNNIIYLTVLLTAATSQWQLFKPERTRYYMIFSCSKVSGTHPLDSQYRVHSTILHFLTTGKLIKESWSYYRLSGRE